MIQQLGVIQIMDVGFGHGMINLNGRGDAKQLLRNQRAFRPTTTPSV